jgi:hypothetical protein
MRGALFCLPGALQRRKMICHVLLVSSMDFLRE